VCQPSNAPTSAPTVALHTFRSRAVARRLALLKYPVVAGRVDVAAPKSGSKKKKKKKKKKSKGDSKKSKKSKKKK
jgi:hypothetical protein